MSEYKKLIDKSLDYNNAKMNISSMSITIFSIGVIGTILMHIFLGGATIFQKNKINRLTMASSNVYVHYLGYLRVFLSYYIPLGYFIVKNSFLKKEKIFHMVGILISFLLISLELNRGDFLFPCIALIVIEAVPDILNNRFVKGILKFLLIVSIFLVIFKVFGDVRVSYVMNNIYKTDINKFYEMKVKNSLFTWSYIYITSPLENFKNILLEHHIENHSYGLLMFYPFFQFFFKLSGNNLNMYSEQVVPDLAKHKGLTVSSFMKDAYIDFGIIGIFIYLLAYYSLIFISIKNIKERNNIYSILAYSMIINILLWSMFVNSLGNGPFLIGLFIFYILSLYQDKYKK